MLTTTEVAARLNLNRATINKWIAEGRLKAIVFKGNSGRDTIRIREEDLEKLLSESYT